MKIVFDDFKSIIHVLLGIITKLIGKSFPPLALALIIVFTVYEVLEKDSPENRLGDFIEYLIGYIIGEITFKT